MLAPTTWATLYICRNQKCNLALPPLKSATCIGQLHLQAWLQAQQESEMDVKAYLDRIRSGSAVPLQADLKTLQELQNRHQTSVPFENFAALKGTITNLKV